MDEIVMVETDIKRWEELSKSNERPSWQSRNDVVVSLIPSGSSVLDVGCGNRDIEKLLNGTSKYQGLDCVGDATNTIIVDFNKVDATQVHLATHYDYAVCSGVLEYIENAKTFLHFVATHSNKIILSYTIKENRNNKDAMSVNGWVNEFTRAELEKLFHQTSLKIIQETKYKKHSIFVLGRINR